MEQSKLPPLVRGIIFVLFLVAMVAILVFVRTDSELSPFAPNGVAMFLILLTIAIKLGVTYIIKKKNPALSFVRTVSWLIAIVVTIPLWLLAYYNDWL